MLGELRIQVIARYGGLPISTLVSTSSAFPGKEMPSTGTSKIHNFYFIVTVARFVGLRISTLVLLNYSLYKYV